MALGEKTTVCPEIQEGVQYCVSPLVLLLGGLNIKHTVWLMNMRSPEGGPDLKVCGAPGGGP